MNTLAINNTPAAPASSQGVPDSMPSIIAMIQALLAMEASLSQSLGDKSQYQIKIQSANAQAVKTAGEKVLQQIKQAEEEASSSSFWGIFGEVFGWIAAALTSILSFGTLSLVAAVAVSAMTVAMQAGAFDKALDKLTALCGGSELAKDLLSCGMVAGVSLGAGLSSEIMAAGANAAKAAVTEASATAIDGQFSTVSKLACAQAIVMYGPQPLQDGLTPALEAMHIPNAEEVAQGLSITICIAAAGYVMGSAFNSPGFDISKPNGGVSATAYNRFQKLASYGAIVSSLSSGGFNIAKGVYGYKEGQAYADEAAPKAMQEFMKDFSDILNQEIKKSTDYTTQVMQNFATINNNFSQLTAPLQAAAQVLG